MIFNFLKKLKIEHIKALFYAVLSFFPGMFLRLFRRNMWLVSETSVSAHDNGYWFFRYVCEEHKEIDICYAIDFSSIEYPKVASLGKTVAFGSFKHHIYTWSCSKNIGTQVASGLPNASVCHRLFMKGFYRFENIFLQHGIIQNKNAVFTKERTNIDCFICSCQREADFVCNVLGHPAENIYTVGLCRYDQLVDDLAEPMILIMPTWRMWLNDLSEEEFKSSNYFLNYSALIQNEKLLAFAQKEKLRIVFFLHDGMQHYSHLFADISPDVIVAGRGNYDVQDLLKRSMFLITDYSSVAFDFAYMKKPLAYFQFDYDEFRAKHCEEGYFSYEEDGMGPVFSSEELLFRFLEDSWSQKDQKFLLESKYVERSVTFFKYCDRLNCKRTFDVINNL